MQEHNYQHDRPCNALCESWGAHQRCLKYQSLKNLFCVQTEELLRSKDDLLSEEGQSLSSILTEQVVRQSLQPNRHSFSLL